MDDRRKCQTFAASPAEPGTSLVGLDGDPLSSFGNDCYSVRMLVDAVNLVRMFIITKLNADSDASRS
jgi:hypothetical protein